MVRSLLLVVAVILLGGAGAYRVLQRSKRSLRMELGARGLRLLETRVRWTGRMDFVAADSSGTELAGHATIRKPKTLSFRAMMDAD